MSFLFLKALALVIPRGCLVLCLSFYRFFLSVRILYISSSLFMLTALKSPNPASTSFAKLNVYFHPSSDHKNGFLWMVCPVFMRSSKHIGFYLTNDHTLSYLSVLLSLLPFFLSQLIRPQFPLLQKLEGNLHLFLISHQFLLILLKHSLPLLSPLTKQASSSVIF